MNMTAAILAWIAIGVVVTRAGMDIFKPEFGPLPVRLPLKARTSLAAIMNVLNAIFAMLAHIPVGTAIPAAVMTFVTALATHAMIPDPGSPLGTSTPPSGGVPPEKPAGSSPFPRRIFRSLQKSLTFRLVFAITLVSFCVGATCKQGIKTAVDSADQECVVLQSNDVNLGPVGGTICVTVEELTPWIDHLLAARKWHAMHPDAISRGTLAIDPCSIPLPPKPLATDAGAL